MLFVNVYTSVMNDMIFYLTYHENNKTPGVNQGFYIKRHRASFPPKGSIIAAARLNFCVRNGNRCFPSAMGTEEKLISVKSRFDVLW